jgi:hypothetical protein
MVIRSVWECLGHWTSWSSLESFRTSYILLNTWLWGGIDTGFSEYWFTFSFTSFWFCYLPGRVTVKISRFFLQRRRCLHHRIEGRVVGWILHPARSSASQSGWLHSTDVLYVDSSTAAIEGPPVCKHLHRIAHIFSYSNSCILAFIASISNVFIFSTKTAFLMCFHRDTSTCLVTSTRGIRS